ncbi:cysteine desulfurase family protein [Diplocloster hominis]|uniref:cysteine desulfurase family protein n=1 Tax=Diplocloster hominis TaxID=3079010 RepID=UPI0031BB1A48
MECYFDNSATTRCYESVKEIMIRTMMTDYGNPSSMHKKGVDAEKYVKDARDIIAKNLKVNAKEIFFTSGGTEGNNLAIIGTAMANRRSGNHVITSAVEHPSVTAAMEYLEGNGFRASYIPVDAEGILRMDALEAALDEETVLVSVMYVNNEIGAVQPIQDIAELVHKKAPKAKLHVDAVQAYGKYRILPKKLGIDLLSASGHKIHGPKGVGFLYVSDKVKIKPISYGGGQQEGMRSGTVNTTGIAGLGAAVKELYTGFDEKIQRLYTVKQAFVNGIGTIEGAVIHGLVGIESAPHIVNVSFPGVRSEVLLHALEEYEIYVSAGSACAAGKKHAVSPTLTAIHLDKDQLESAIRFSFHLESTVDEVNYCIEKLQEIVPKLKKYTRR